MTPAWGSPRRWAVDRRRVLVDRARHLRRWERRPVTSAIQIAKATLAAIMAWYLSGVGLQTMAAWLAPVTAVLMVHNTVYRSVTEGFKRVIAVGAGILIAATIGTAIGLNTLGLLLMVPVSLLLGRLPWVNSQGEYITVTSVLLLTFGAATYEQFLLSYVLNAAIGSVIGALVNMALFPPGYQRDARAALAEFGDRIAGLLCELADGIRGGWSEEQIQDWHLRAGRLDAEARDVRAALGWSREGQRWNPWLRNRPAATSDYATALDTLWQVAIELRGLTRAIRDATPPADESEELSRRLPPMWDDLSPLLESVAEVVERWGHEPSAWSGEVTRRVADAVAEAENRQRDMARRLPQAGITDPELFAGAGAVVQVSGQILQQVRQS